jgi:prophage antirepressor-like protein
MVQQVQLFKFSHDGHFDNIRTAIIDGEIWFVASDVATVLGYANPRDAIARHCKEKGVVKHDIVTPKGPQAMTMINEPNVYRLIVKSQLPSAERFEAWVFEEVIPSIRKTGGYGIDRYETPNFIIRYFENYNKIESGHFSVITELYIRLYARFEHVGYKIPNKAWNGKEIRPDVSVGICFANYLRDNYPSAPKEFRTYTHSFPGGQEVEARMYPVDLLPIFIKYIDEVWIPNNAEKYFYERDRKALDFLPKLLKH